MNDDFCEMFCQLSINCDVLKKYIPYKYVVHSPKTQGKKHASYEYLGKFYSRVINRVLHVESLAISQGGRFAILCALHYHDAFSGVYHKFDTMAFPEDKTVSSRFRGYLKSFKSFIGIQGDNLIPPTDFEMRKICLLFYLERYKDIIVSAQFECTCISKCVEEIEHIFTSLLVVSTVSSGTPVSLGYVNHDNKDEWRLLKV